MTFNEIVLSGLMTIIGVLISLLYRELRHRIASLERRQTACFQLMIRVAMNTGTDEQTIKDIQKAVGIEP